MTARAATAFVLLAAAARADLASEAARAFRDDEPAGRIELLAGVRAHIAGADERARNKAAAAVDRAIREEPAPEVRCAALDFLLALRTERACDRLVAGVLDPDPSVVAHVRGLVAGRDDLLLHEAIVRALREDASWRFRAAMVDLLLAGAWEDAKAPLVDALSDVHPAVAARAAEVLERLTGEPLGVDPDAWRSHFAAQAAKVEAARDPDETVTVATRKKAEVREGPIRGLAPTLYGIPVKEKRVVFVVDMSSSMRKGVRSVHFAELKKAIFGLPSDASFNVLCFDQRMFFFVEAKSLRPADTEAKVEVERWLDNLPAGERTDVTRSVASGLAMLNEALAVDGRSRAELFILTDGRETVQTYSPRGVERQFEKLPEGRCRVHVVLLGRHGTPSLRSLAALSGGTYVEAPER